MRKLVLSLALVIDAAVAGFVWRSTWAPDRAIARAEVTADAGTVERFVAEFDQNIKNDPIAADIIARDDRFRAAYWTRLPKRSRKEAGRPRTTRCRR